MTRQFHRGDKRHSEVLKVQRTELVRDNAVLIDGAWVAADRGDTLEVRNPANGDLVGRVPYMGQAETQRAVEAAARAMRHDAPLEQRRGWIQRIGDLLVEHQEMLGEIITLEHGKPLREGIAEVQYAAGFFHFFASCLDELQPRRYPEKLRGCQWEVHHRPAGVVASITPWNFPIGMMAKKVPAALGCGCGVVAKPASATPLSAVAFASIVEKADVPAGMFNVVTGSASRISQVICQHPEVRIISFTGSTEVGRELGAATAPHIKRLAMELGGNAPFIVFADADLDLAAEALVANKFRGAGQTCVCTNRVYVHRDVEPEFTARVAELAENLRVGDGLDPATDIGPLINRAGFDKVVQHVRDALDGGASLVVGSIPSTPENDWGCFFPPTVITNVEPRMLVCRDETFGPLVAISRFDDEAEVLRKANDTEYGLAAYVCTSDPDRAKRVAAGLSFGHVGINTGMSPTPELPFGGMKQSGYGREGGVEGLLEFCEVQTIVRS